MLEINKVDLWSGDVEGCGIGRRWHSGQMVFKHPQCWRAGECVKKNQQREYWCPTSAMVHTRANWSTAAPHGTSLDRLHHLNSMSSLTIHLDMLEQTQTYTHTSISLGLKQPNTETPLRKRAIIEKEQKNDLLFNQTVCWIHNQDIHKPKAKTRTVTLPCRSLIQSRLQVIPTTSATQRDSRQLNAAVTMMITNLFYRETCINSGPVHEVQWNRTVLQTIQITMAGKLCLNVCGLHTEQLSVCEREIPFFKPPESYFCSLGQNSYRISNSL